jgi:hypothetical protein
MTAILLKNQKPLMVAGLVSFIFFLVTAALIFVDPAQILGISRWIKPAKFFISIAIFLWTMGVYFEQLPSRAGLFRKLSWAMIIVFVIEMLVIAGQSLRMKRSHFNNDSPLDDALFSVMGISIVALTILVAWVAVIFWRSNEFTLPRSVVWGMRLGLVVILLGSIEGGYMSTQGGHAVGLADGGAGLPLVNWSTEGGDLRVAHFLGLHGLQAVPMFALLWERLRLPSGTAATIAFAVLYAALFTGLFIQALLGRPLITVF